MPPVASRRLVGKIDAYRPFFGASRVMRSPLRSVRFIRARTPQSHGSAGDPPLWCPGPKLLHLLQDTSADTVRGSPIRFSTHRAGALISWSHPPPRRRAYPFLSRHTGCRFDGTPFPLETNGRGPAALPGGRRCPSPRCRSTRRTEVGEVRRPAARATGPHHQERRGSLPFDDSPEEPFLFLPLSFLSLPFWSALVLAFWSFFLSERLGTRWTSVLVTRVARVFIVRARRSRGGYQGG